MTVSSVLLQAYAYADCQSSLAAAVMVMMFHVISSRGGGKLEARDEMWCVTHPSSSFAAYNKYELSNDA
jgi:hypothetical protein